MTRTTKGPFAVSWPKQLGEQNVTTITITLKKAYKTLKASFVDFGHSPNAAVIAIDTY